MLLNSENNSSVIMCLAIATGSISGHNFIEKFFFSNSAKTGEFMRNDILGTRRFGIGFYLNGSRA